MILIYLVKTYNKTDINNLFFNPIRCITRKVCCIWMEPCEIRLVNGKIVW